MILPVPMKQWSVETILKSTEAPMGIVKQWYADALASQEPIADRFTLATVDPQGYPSARIVLVKGIEPEFIVFYTNYESQKAKQLALCPKASAVFYWPTLKRQIRLLGDVKKQTPKENEVYFQSRPRLSQLGAWASRQSQPLDSRETLIKKVDEEDKRFQGSKVPCPDHWGGFRLFPIQVEFWEDGDGRLHDRAILKKDPATHAWSRTRLYP